MATGALVAFTALSAGMSIYQGVQQNAAYTEQGINLMKQAQIAQQENAYAVRQKQREIDRIKFNNNAMKRKKLCQNFSSLGIFFSL